VDRRGPAYPNPAGERTPVFHVDRDLHAASLIARGRQNIGHLADVSAPRAADARLTASKETT
jgi:hypothetical protein